MTGPNGLARIADRIAECVHCGFCLPTCPTYAELGSEPDSPRGRIWIVRALAEGRAEPTDALLGHLDGCLDCRACETACPSGVRYGEILETARAALEPARRRPLMDRVARRIGFRSILTHRGRLGAISRFLRVLDRSGVGAAARRAAFLPEGIRSLLRLAPRPADAPFIDSSPARIAAVPPMRGRVVLFTGCVMDATMGHLHAATVRVLAANGFEVLVPREQTCCGALHVHAGRPADARRMARRNVRVFEAAGADRVLVNSAGCGAQLREYDRLLADDPRYADRAREWAERTEDVLVFLDREGLRTAPAPARCRAVYDEPCHLLHAQGVSAAPKRLLASVPGLTLLPLPEADFCCGSAGIYNLTESAMAERLNARKAEKIAETGAELVITANPGCLLQIRAGLEDRGLAVPVRHVIELLVPRARAAGGERPSA